MKAKNNTGDEVRVMGLNACFKNGDIRELKNLGFLQLPHQLEKVTHDISETPSQRGILLALYHLTLGEQSTRCEISVRGIAKHTGFSKNTVHSAFQSFERRGLLHYLIKSRIIGIPSLIELPWLQEYLPVEQKKLREAKKRAHLQVVPDYGSDNVISETQKCLMEPQYLCESEVKMQVQEDQKPESIAPPFGTIDPHLTQSVVPIFGTDLRIPKYENSFINTMYHTPTSAPDSASKPIHADLIEKKEIDILAVTREMLRERWEKMAKGCKGIQIENEKKFFKQLKQVYPEDITLALLTITHFEKTGADFLGRKCDNPLELLSTKWHWIRTRSMSELGEKVEQIQGMTLTDYQAQKEKRRLEQEMLKQSHEEEPQFEPLWEEALKKFLEAFSDQAKRDAAIEQFASTWAVGRTALWSAAKNWWDQQVVSQLVSSSNSTGEKVREV